MFFRKPGPSPIFNAQKQTKSITMKTLETTISTYGFEPITLEEMDRVRLMNRTDTKFWFHRDRLSEILEKVRDKYFVLNMQNDSTLPYHTVYFDTDKSAMYRAHHNGKLNRYKVRRRTYVQSGINFLEIKFKNNKGRTIKKRVSGDGNSVNFSEREKKFLRENLPFPPEMLVPQLINHFKRITLVNKNFDERCTIDIDLYFESNLLRYPLTNIAIIEVKREGTAQTSPIVKVLNELRIKQSGFSKYCTGRILTDPFVKYNALKPRLRQLKKQLNTPIYFFN